LLVPSKLPIDDRSIVDGEFGITQMARQLAEDRSRSTHGRGDAAPDGTRMWAPPVELDGAAEGVFAHRCCPAGSIATTGAASTRCRYVRASESLQWACAGKRSPRRAAPAFRIWRPERRSRI